MPPPPRSVPLFTAYVTGDNFFPEDIHDQNRHIRDAGFYYMIAAEAINTDGGDPPLALYLLTNGNVGLADANDSTKNILFGFATNGQNIAVGERVEVVSIQGAKVRGFSGLTIGTDYFVTNDATGAIGTSDTGMLAGTAADEDTLELKKVDVRAALAKQYAFKNTDIAVGTSEETLLSFTLNANDLGTNGVLRITIVGKANNGTSGFLINVDWGGTAAQAQWTKAGGSTNSEFIFTIQIANRDNASAQVIQGYQVGWGGNSEALSLETATEDTTADVIVGIRGHSISANALVIDLITVELLEE